LFFTIYLWIDTAMLSLMTNPTVVGWYGVPMRLWGSFFIPAAILSKVFFPRLVAAHERSRSEFTRVARTPIELVLILSLPVATAIVVGAAPVMRLLYGPSYAHSAPILIILGITLIPMCLNMILGSISVAEGRQRILNWLMVGATLFNPAVNAVLIPLTQREYGNGGIGAAIALLLTETLVASASMVIFGRGIVGLSTLERVVRMGVACGGMWLTVHLLRGTGSVISLAAGCCALVVLAIVVKAVTPEEQRQIRGFAEKFASKATAAVAGLRARRGDRGLISNRSTRKGPTARPLENGVTVRSDPPTAPREPAPVET
jgi:O-antigen/teichoic acid export membrane protein